MFPKKLKHRGTRDPQELAAASPEGVGASLQGGKRALLVLQRRPSLASFLIFWESEQDVLIYPVSYLLSCTYSKYSYGRGRGGYIHTSIAFSSSIWSITRIIVAAAFSVFGEVMSLPLIALDCPCLALMSSGSETRKLTPYRTW